MFEWCIDNCFIVYRVEWLLFIINKSLLYVRIIIIISLLVYQ